MDMNKIMAFSLSALKDEDWQIKNVCRQREKSVQEVRDGINALEKLLLLTILELGTIKRKQCSDCTPYLTMFAVKVEEIEVEMIKIRTEFDKVIGARIKIRRHLKCPNCEENVIL